MRPNSQDAVREFRPYFDVAPVYGHGPSLEEFTEQTPLTVGSPQQVIEKVLRYREILGHEVIQLHADGDGLTPRRHREALEQFQSDVAPALRAAIPSRPLAAPIPPDPDDTRPRERPQAVAS